MTDGDNAKFIFNGPVGSVGGHVNVQYFGCNFIQNKGDETVDTPAECEEGLTVSASKSEDEVKQPVKTGGGRRKTPLFMKDDGTKDEELTRKKAELFTAYLAQHHSASSRQMEVQNENYIAKVFIAFYQRWRREGSVSNTINGRACFRFLNEECGLACGTTEKAYGDWIKLRLESSKPDAVIDGYISDFLQKVNRRASI